MPASEFFCKIVGINPLKLSKAEAIILETELFYGICTELQTYYKHQLVSYFQVMKFDTYREESMIDEIFVKCIVNDLLEEYTIEGIAFHTQLPQDVIYELASGQNTNPSLSCIRKIIELHRNIRPTLYNTMVKKIVSDHQNRYN